MPSARAPDPPPLLILSPVYEDWDAARLLLASLDAELGAAGLRADVLFVDDGSRRRPEPIANLEPTALGRVTVLPLRRNLGHQRAIALGLCYAEQRLPRAAVVVMDCDGEDAPSDVPHLVAKLRETDGDTLVFAERSKRLENAAFQLLYRVYRVLHYWLTGISVRVGNFSIVPPAVLHRLVAVSELWNHYAAAVFASRIPYTAIPTARGRRFAGQSKMNFVALVGHGLSAISVHSERLAVRVLSAIVVALALAGAVLLSVLVVRVTTNWAIPGWASSVILALLVLIAQLVTLSIVFVFTILHRRSSAAFLPLRDYPYYVDEPFELVRHHAPART